MKTVILALVFAAAAYCQCGPNATLKPIGGGKQSCVPKSTLIGTDANGNVAISGTVLETDISTPAPDATRTQLYAKSGKWCAQSTGGVESCTGGSGATISSGANAIVKSDNAGNGVATGCTIDSSNNLTCPGTLKGASVSVEGAAGVASWIDYLAGTPAGSIPANTFRFEAPSSITSYAWHPPAAEAAGLLYDNGSGQLGYKVIGTDVAPLASPTFTGTVGGITAAMVGLGSVTNDAQTKAAVVPNTAPGAGQILVGNAGGTAYAPVGMTGDCSLASTGAISCSATSGANTALSNLASVAINTTLLPASSGSADLGSTTKPFGALYATSNSFVGGATAPTVTSKLVVADGTNAVAITLMGKSQYSGGSTDNNNGIRLSLGFNGTGTRYLMVEDSAATINSTNVGVRVGVGGSSPTIEAFKLDNSGAGPITFGNTATNTHLGGGAVYLDSGSGNQVYISGTTVQINGLHSTTGTRYVCADTSGNLVSSASACSGT